MILKSDPGRCLHQAKDDSQGSKREDGAPHVIPVC